MILPFWHLHASNAALLHYLLPYCCNLNGCYEIVNISLYIKFVPSRLKTLLITKQDVVEEIK